MPSLRARIVARLVPYDAGSSSLRSVQALHDLMAQGGTPPGRAGPPAPLRRAVRVARGTVAGQPGHRLAPRHGGAGRPVLFFHGGGFVNAITPYHWLFLARLVRTAGCTVTVPAYELVPRVRAGDAVASALAVVRALSAERPVLMGDSAGANLALAVAQAARDEGVPVGGDVVLVSPWADVSMRNPEIAAVAPRDPMLGAEALAEAGRRYAGDGDPALPPASPLHGDLSNLGRLTILTGTRDILNPDARRLRDLASAAPGTTVDFVEEPEMLHDWMLLPIPEATAAVERVAAAVSRPAARR
jgi:monoterpene epsilon-lactone hydrolase